MFSEIHWLFSPTRCGNLVGWVLLNRDVPVKNPSLHSACYLASLTGESACGMNRRILHHNILSSGMTNHLVVMLLNNPLFTALVLVRSSHVPIDALGPSSKVRAIMGPERKKYWFSDRVVEMWWKKVIQILLDHPLSSDLRSSFSPGDFCCCFSSALHTNLLGLSFFYSLRWNCWGDLIVFIFVWIEGFPSRWSHIIFILFRIQRWGDLVDILFWVCRRSSCRGWFILFRCKWYPRWDDVIL